MTKFVYKSALLAAASLGLLASLAGRASAQDAPISTAPPSTATSGDQALAERLAKLEQDEADLRQEISDLKTQTATTTDDLSNRLNATTISLPGGKPAIATADGNFTANLRGVFQIDAAQYFQKNGLSATTLGRDLNSGTNIRRFRIGLDGKLFHDFDYSILTDFGGSGTDGGGVIQEGYVQYNGLTLPGVTVAGSPAAVRIRAGVFAPNLGLEDAASTSTAIFPERPTPAELARSLAGADKRIGLQVGVNSDRWLASGAVTGAKAGDNATADEQLGFVGRLAVTPFKGPGFLVHVGVNGSYVDHPAQSAAGAAYSFTTSDRPELRVDGTQLISLANINAAGTSTSPDAKHISQAGVELAVQKNGFLFQSEYYEYRLERRNPAAITNDFTGWYAEASYLVGGAGRKYNTITGAFDAPTITSNFSVKNHSWGAWEFGVRYSDADLNDAVGGPAIDQIRGGDQAIWTGQVNWFFNPAVRVGLSYQDVSIDRRNTAGTQIGQDYQAVDFRTSLAF